MQRIPKGSFVMEYVGEVRFFLLYLCTCLHCLITNTISSYVCNPTVVTSLVKKNSQICKKTEDEIGSRSENVIEAAVSQMVTIFYRL